MKRVPITLKVSDIENDSLAVSFYYNQRTGGRQRRNQMNKLNSRGSLATGFEIQLPKEHGAIKVYVNVKDSYNNVGIASNSILVADENVKNKNLAAKTELPSMSTKMVKSLTIPRDLWATTNSFGKYEF